MPYLARNAGRPMVARSARQPFRAWRLTKATHWPWFLKPNCLQPPFLHCCLLVGPTAIRPIAPPMSAGTATT